MMKRILLLLCLVLTFSITEARKLIPGTSTALLPSFSEENLVLARKAGFKTLEYGLSAKLLSLSFQQCEKELSEAYQKISKAGLKVWSCHLPFGRNIDISSPDSVQRKQIVESISTLIRACAVLEPECLILHPSYEPISDNERQQRIEASIESIGLLRLAANEIGAVLCIENLPRTCLGRNSDEIIRLIERYPDVAVCFDVNHLLEGSQSDFVENVGRKIATLHISDYDRVNERHWIPGQGVIAWGDLYSTLIQAGYNGPWMYETINDRAEKGKKATFDQVMDSHSMIVSEYKHSR